MRKILKIFYTVMLFALSVFCVFSLGNNVNAASYDSYYTSVNTTSGQKLIESLTSIISSGHNDLGYKGLWSAYHTTDVKPGTNYVWDMYSNENFVVGGSKQGANYSKEGDGYNREHSVPQSWFNESSPMKSDLFHVYPTDGYVNNRRGNYPFGETDNPSYTSGNGSKLGSSSFAGYSGTVFEPIDQYKGDFARTYFYMATRYRTQVGSWGSGASTVFKGSFPYLTDYAVNLFTKWHTEDPVSEKEIDRNDAVYSLQKNRNPYIDHPEYVNAIWGNGEIAESKYKVTYSVGNDVTFSYTDNAEYTSGSSIKEPTVNPTKDGYTFAGWTANTNSRVLWDFDNDKITKNITLYPLWNASSPNAFNEECSIISTQLMANYTSTTTSTGEVVAAGYTLVNDVNDLSAGDKIIIVNKTDSKALSTTQNNNNRSATSITISNDIIESISNDVQVITLETGAVTGTFGLNVGNGYLYAASGGNYLRTQATLNSDASFKIEISSDNATITAQGSSPKNILMYNNNDKSRPLYGCYSGGQQPVSIYKQTTGAGSVTTYEPTDVGIRYSYHISLDIYNAFVDEYDFGFENNSSILIDVTTEQVTYNGVVSVKVSYSFDSITNYETVYNVKPVLIEKEDNSNKTYGKSSIGYSVKTLANHYLTNVNNSFVNTYKGLLEALAE